MLGHSLPTPKPARIPRPIHNKHSFGRHKVTHAHAGPAARKDDEAKVQPDKLADKMPHATKARIGGHLVSNFSPVCAGAILP
jgi:hypothetical protein